MKVGTRVHYPYRPVQTGVVETEGDTFCYVRFDDGVGQWVGRDTLAVLEPEKPGKIRLVDMGGHYAAVSAAAPLPTTSKGKPTTCAPVKQWLALPR